MAKVFDSYSFLPGNPRKKNLAHLVARTREVQMELSEQAANGARRARAELTRHRHDGDSEIVVTKGDIDRYVWLSDEKGLKHALSIEYGREPNPETGKGGMEGLYILHHAFQIRRR